MIMRRWGVPYSQGDRLRVNHAALALTVPPAQEPMTIDTVKEWLRVTYTDQDNTITELISAARQRVEAYLRRALLTQTWTLTLDWGPSWIELPWPPLQSVTQIQVTGLDGTPIIVDPSVYLVTPSARLVSLRPSQAWPAHLTPMGFQVTFVCGYGSDPSAIPASILSNMKVLINHAFENRMSIDEIPAANFGRLSSYRIVGPPWRMAKGIETPEFLS